MHKVIQILFVWNETWHTILFGIYCVEIVRIENNSHMLESTCYVPFYSFLSVFGTFSYNVIQIGLFGMKHGTEHYLVYTIMLIWLETKNSHMLEITCLVPFL